MPALPPSSSRLYFRVVGTNISQLPTQFLLECVPGNLLHSNTGTARQRYGLMSAASKKNKKDAESLSERIQELEALLKDHGVQSPYGKGTTDAHVLT